MYARVHMLCVCLCVCVHICVIQEYRIHFYQGLYSDCSEFY